MYEHPFLDIAETISRILAVNGTCLTQSRGREQSNRYPDKHIFSKYGLMFGSFHVWSQRIPDDIESCCNCPNHLVTADVAAQEVGEGMLEGGGT